MMPPRRRFAADEDGQAAWEILGVLAMLAIPLALFALLFVYLHRTIHAGPLLEEASPAPPPVAAPSPVRGARPCRRCGVTVRPTRGAMGMECPNCGAGMPV